MIKRALIPYLAFLAIIDATATFTSAQERTELRPVFEVASIKPSPPQSGRMITFGCRGGPGTESPKRWICERANLWGLVMSAFDLRSNFQLQGLSPGYMAWFTIIANIPEGATKEQFRQMQQSLAIERFGLKYHYEQKEIQGYELVVAKSGPKFSESKSESPKDSPKEPRIGKDGFPVIPPGTSGVVMSVSRAHGQWIGTTMNRIADYVSGEIGSIVVDGTGLAGKYDISLDWTPEPKGMVVPSLVGAESNMPSAPEPSDPTLLKALQEQLGLNLQPKKVPMKILVIDHAEKTPTEN
jgi:uncharacterized protein (TIGR03435 family)